MAMLALAALAVAGLALAAPAAAADAPASNYAAAQDSTSDSTFDVTTTYRLDPDSEGYLIDLTIHNPELAHADGVYFRVQTGGHRRRSVVDSSDFVEGDFGGWYPERGLDEATMTLAVSEETATEPPVTDEYGVFHGTATDLSYTSIESSVSVERRFQPDGFHDDRRNLLFLGAYQNHTASTEHGPVTLIAPASVDLAAPPRDVTAALTEVSERHDAGKQYDRMYAFPARVHNNASGEASGISFWSMPTSTVNGADSTWVHEFVHMADGVERAETFDWYQEALANYYMAYYPFEASHTDSGGVFADVSYEDYRSVVDEGRELRVNLSDTSQWGDGTVHDEADYDQGSAVLGAIDYELRRTTDASLVDLVRRLERRDGDVTHGEFLDAVEAVGGSELRSKADGWIAGDATPPTWTLQEHTDAFGYGVSDVAQRRVTATAQTDDGAATLDESDERLLRTGDTVQFSVTLENEGTGAKTVERTLTVDDAVVDVASATVQPGSTATLQLSHDLSTPGHHTVATSDYRVGVVAVPDGATVLREDGPADAADSAARIGPESTLAFVTESVSVDVQLQQTDGTEARRVDTAEGNRVVVMDAADLAVGATYEVNFPLGIDGAKDTQYVEVAGTPPEVQITDVPSERRVGWEFRVVADATRGSGNVTSYEWEFGDGETASHFWTTHTYDQPGQHQVEVTVTDEYGQTATDTATVDVYARPPEVGIVGPSSIPAGDEFEAWANVSAGDGEIASYDWNFGDGTTASGQRVAHTYADAGTYEAELTVTDEYGNVDTDQLSVDVSGTPDPHGEIAPSTTTASAGESVSFGIDQHTDYISQMQWSMGDGTTYGTDYWVTHSYDSPGTYAVTLETKSGHDGTWTTDTVTIEVN